jgi:hypothetical protein
MATRAALSIAALGLALGAVACGSAKQAAEPAAPEAVASDGATATSLEGGEDEANAGTTDEAAERFASAERQLDDMFAPGAGAEPGIAPPGPPTPMAPPPSGAPPTMQKSEQTPLAQDRCTNACRALASMQRSAARLCDLAGSEDARCSDVSARVERAQARVRQACPACEAARGG